MDMREHASVMQHALRLGRDNRERFSGRSFSLHPPGLYVRCIFGELALPYHGYHDASAFVSLSLPPP